MSFEELSVKEMRLMSRLREEIEDRLQLSPEKGNRWANWTAADMIQVARKLGIDVSMVHVRQCVAYVTLD